MLNIPWTIGVMTPSHRQWSEFYNKLGALVSEGGCNHSHIHAITVLALMGAEVRESVEHFEQHGGFCDCEVLMNVGGEA
jgi:hypothetical protein